MAAISNVGSTTSGSSRRTSSSGGRAGSVASSLSKTLSVSSNAEVNSSETSSGSFSCMTTTTSSGTDGAVAAAPEMAGGSRRSPSVGGKNKKRFVGVRQRPSGRWVAEIKDTTQKIRLWLGTFDTAEDAARAYDEAAWLLRGANTRTNFVPSTSTDASVLPSKAARLLQLRRNAAASSEAMNSRQQGQATSKIDADANTPASIPQKSVPIPPADSPSDKERSPPPVAPAPFAEVIGLAGSGNFPSADENSKSESSSFESSVEEMCGLEEAAAAAAAGGGGGQEYNATSGLANEGLFHQEPDLGVGRRSDHSHSIVKQEIAHESYQPPPTAIRENRKEKDYCADAPPQESFVDDTDMSSGLSGLEDVDLSCVDSVYSCSPFEFPVDMGPGLDLGNLISSPLSAELANGEDDSLSEHMRRMSYERHSGPGMYAMNDSLPFSSHCNSWGMSSPSLTFAAGFRRPSSSGPFVTASPAWKVSSSGSASSGSGSWGASPAANASSAASGNATTGENADCPSQDALWQSWDLPPLCVVA